MTLRSVEVTTSRGPCAKRQTICVITTAGGTKFRGANDCANPQAVCPRLPGEGYEKCQSICQQAGHAEAEAIKTAGEHAKGARAELWGHYYICEPCGRALREAGITSLTIYPAVA